MYIVPSDKVFNSYMSNKTFKGATYLFFYSPWDSKSMAVYNELMSLETKANVICINSFDCPKTFGDLNVKTVPALIQHRDTKSRRIVSSHVEEWPSRIVEVVKKNLRIARAS